ncbi:hypothetical protein [Streptomyces sp. NPDC093093]|uniref:hypothetical protein n=1 Tax=Streptomyces sp. NPDC093093 TaxID=3366025 RepID=UPI0037F404A1
MRTHRTIMLLATAGLLAVTGCTSTEASKPEAPAKPASSPTTATPNPDARRVAAGLPVEPRGAARTAFLAGLDAIDTDIVHGKDDKAISRGIDTCGLIKRFPNDKAGQVDQTNKRWISATHPEGHGLAKAGKILEVARKNICPDF